MSSYKEQDWLLLDSKEIHRITIYIIAILQVKYAEVKV